MAYQSFFGELRRRHIFRVAIAYAVTAWLLLQLAAIVLPTFTAPHWVLKVLIGVFVLCFPLAIMLAWAFESTPEGVRRTVPAESEEARPEATGRKLGRKIDFVIIVVLTAAVGVLAWQRFSAPTKEAAIPAKSIAVLPFENLSTDKANAYFAAGMQDLILTKLADIGGLKVISRTSTMQYGSHPENLSQVGEQLGVATVLEGSVQRIGEQVLVNVQLIDAHSDSHIWAKSYTRTLKNVFGVEGEVAETIANTLNAKLTAPEKRQLAAAPTTNAAAYNAYLRGRALADRLGPLDSAAQKHQIAAYREAVAHDPLFAVAWARLASAELSNYWLYEPTPGVLAAARRALDKAQSLAPNDAATQLALGDYDYYGRADYPAALVAFKNVLARAPNSVAALRRVARIERRLGRWQAAVTHYRRALVLDPRNVGLLEEAANTFAAVGELNAARALVNRALVLSPGDPTATQQKAGIDQEEGQFAAANKLLTTLKADFDTEQAIVLGWTLTHDYGRAVRAGRAAVADPSCRSSEYARSVCYYWLGYAEHLAGQTATARADLRRAVAAAHGIPQTASQADKAFGYDALGLSEALLGHKAAALDAAHKAVALLPPSKDAMYGPINQHFLAYVEAWVGERGGAIKLLRHLLTVPVSGVTVPLLRADPGWDSLRSDPRFQALLKQNSTPAPSATSSY